MAINTINVGVAPNDGNGDSIRDAFIKVNANEADLDGRIITTTPQDFGAIGDGITDDTTAIQNAVASANANNLILTWPTGTYLTTASIANFHNVIHVGEGVVKRGAETLTIELRKGGTNKIFVSATGVDTNDGLSSAEPFLTLQAALDAVVTLRSDDGAFWQIQLGAGIYTEGVILAATSQGGQKISILGPVVTNSVGNSIVSAIQGGAGTFVITEVVTGGTSGATGTVSEVITSAGKRTMLEIAITSGVFVVGETITGGTSGATGALLKINVKPSAIIDGTSAVNANGIVISTSERFDIKNIQIQDFTAAGLRGEFSFIDLENVHVRDCLDGYFFSNRVSYNAKGGLIHTCSKGIQELFNIVRNLLTVSALADGTEIRNCTHGVFAKEHCTGHLDFSTIEDNEFGVFLNRSSTANASDAVIRRNDQGAVLYTGSFLVPNRIDWGNSTTDGNTLSNWIFSGGSGFVEDTGETTVTVPPLGMVEEQIGHFVGDVSHTGDTVETLLTNVGEYTTGSLMLSGQYLRVIAHGRMTGANANASIRLELGGSNMLNLVIPAGNYDFILDMWISAITPTSQDVSGDARFSVTPFIDVARVTRALDFNATTTRNIEIKVALTNAADIVSIFRANAYSNGMGNE